MGTLTELNWKESLVLAVRLLPSRLGANVNWPDENEAVVTIAFEPEDRNCVCELRRIQVRYFESFRDRGWPPELQSLFGPTGQFEYKSDWPIISVRGDYYTTERLLFVEHTSTDDLAKQLRTFAFAEYMLPSGN